jgi:hypothetical protein
MQIADRRTHLIVGVRGDVFHQKVDEAGVALEDPENLERAIGGLGDPGGWGGLRWRWRFFLRKAEILRDVGW